MKAPVFLLYAVNLAWLAQAAALMPAQPGRLVFEPEARYTDTPAQFLARVPGYSVSISRDDATIQAGKAVIQLRFTGGRTVRLEGMDRLPGVVNYLSGNPAACKRRIPTFAQVRGRSLYPGVDIVFHGNDGHLEYDFIVAPGADPSRIGVQFRGARNIRIDGQGDLMVDTGVGELRQKRPRIYQDEQLIEGHYRLKGNLEVALVLSHYDRGRALVIDPELVYAAQVGLGRDGTNQNPAGIAVDRDGNVYVAGQTIIQEGAFAAYRVFVTKLDPSGQNVLYTTYFGGSSSYLFAGGITVDQAGSAYITGTEGGDGFQTTSGAVSVAQRGTFVAKLNPAGDSLAYAAIVTDNSAAPSGIAIDKQGNSYITGTTLGNFPVTRGAYWTTPPQYSQYPNGLGPSPSPVDGFVLKLNPQGSSVVYATYTNTSGQMIVFAGLTAGPGVMRAIAVDASGNAYVAGIQVLKLNATGSRLIYSLPFEGNAIALDTPGNVYVAGSADGHAFVTGLDPDGHPYFTTKLGGEHFDSASGVAIDSAGHVFVAGNTLSANFPLLSPVQEAFSPSTGFLAELDNAGYLIFSTYAGNEHFFNITGLALDPAGNPILSGYTNNGSVVVDGAIVYPFSGQAQSAYVAKYDTSGIPALRLDSLGNLASQLAVPLSAGELISARGAGFGGDTQLFFDGHPAIMIPGAAMPTAAVPYDFAGRSYTAAHVESGGQSSNTVLVPVAAAAPGVFTVDGTGAGQALAFNQDETPNSQANPAKIGSTVTFYATGTGQTVSGAPALPLIVYVGSNPATIAKTSVGAAPGVAGDVLAVQVTVPSLRAGSLVPGTADVEMIENGLPSREHVWLWVTQ